MNTVDEIKHLYHNTTKTTIQRDLTRAITLLKTLGTEEERERVAVFMDGLSQMRSEWGVRPAAEPGSSGGPATKAASRPGPRPAATKVRSKHPEPRSRTPR